MRIIHTADWHLGRIFHGIHLTQDQAHVLLGQFLSLVRDVKPDLVLLAGDIYDRAVPPPEAVELLDEVLNELVALGSPVAIISGNHDSARRLGFGSKIFERSDIHLACGLDASREPLVFEDEHGPVQLHMLPFSDPPVVRAHFGDDTIQNHAAAMKALLNSARAKRSPKRRHIVMAHATVVGASQSDSERSLGGFAGTNAVSAEHLRGFDYAALGHLHTAQTIDGHIHYPGSLLKYSFGEADEAKGFSVVNLDKEGGVRIEPVPIAALRDVRKVHGHLADLLADPGGKSREDFIMAVLFDTGALLDPIGRLRETYPNVLQIERTALEVPSPTAAPRDHRRQTHQELFEAFFKEVTGQTLSEEEGRILSSIVEKLSQEDREVAS